MNKYNNKKTTNLKRNEFRIRNNTSNNNNKDEYRDSSWDN